MSSLRRSVLPALCLVVLLMPRIALAQAETMPEFDSRNGDECRAKVKAMFEKPGQETHGNFRDVEISRYMRGCTNLDIRARNSIMVNAFPRLSNAKRALVESQPLNANQRLAIEVDHEAIQKLAAGPDRDSYLMMYQDFLRYANAPPPTSTTGDPAVCALYKAQIAANQQKQDEAVQALLSIDGGKPSTARNASPEWKADNARREAALLDLEWQQFSARAAGCKVPGLVTQSAPSPANAITEQPGAALGEMSGRFSGGGNYLNEHRGASVTMLGDGAVLVYGNGIRFDDATSQRVHTDLLRHRLQQGNAQSVDPSPNYWDPVRRGWRKLASPPECASPTRYLHTATALPDGKVLIAGGLCDLPKFANDTAQHAAYAALSLWDTVSRQWLIAPSLQQARVYHTASLMPDGSVLIVGGESDPALSQSAQEPVLNSVELVSQGAVTSLNPLANARALHTTTVLPDGSAVVIGGYDADNHPLASVEMWSPADRSWHALPSLHVARYAHTATLLKDGRIVVTGGVDSDGGSQLSVEIWNPDRQTWSVGPELPMALHGHAATLLASGKILVAGGAPSSAILKPTPWAWTLDPNATDWELAGNVMQSRPGELGGNITLAPRADGSASVFTNQIIMRWEPSKPGSLATDSQAPLWNARPSATQLLNDRVMLVGYQVGNPGAAPPTAHIWDPKTDQWRSAGRLNHAIWFDELIQLRSGRVIHVGLDGDKSYYCESWLPGESTWQDCGSGTLDYVSQWTVALDTLSDGRAFVIANRHEILVFDETSLRWTLWPVEWSTEGLTYGSPIRSDKPFARIVDPVSGQSFEINDAAARFWRRSATTPTPSMLWNGKSAWWDYIFIEQTMGADARLLPDGCAISAFPAAVFNPLNGKVTGLADPGFGVEASRYAMLVLRDGTVVVTGAAPGAADLGSGFFHRKASCAGFEENAADTGYISGGLANDNGAAAPVTSSPTAAADNGGVMAGLRKLVGLRWLQIACLTIAGALLLRKLGIHRLRLGPAWLRLVIVILCLIFVLPAIWKYVRFSGSGTLNTDTRNHASNVDVSGIPCRMVGVWSSRRAGSMRRIELKEDGTYAMDAANVGMDAPGGYTGQWVVRGEEMVWHHDQFPGVQDVNTILPQSETRFALAEGNGSHTDFELIRSVASTHCSR